METKLVNVRLPEQLYEEGKEAVTMGGFANFQEFIKDAIRHRLEEVKRQRALAWLRENFGSTKNKVKKPFTKGIREKLALEHTPEEARKITEMFGL